MTKSEVRQLFGEAEKISVIHDSEFWDYGLGSMTFTVDADHPDGWLYEWFEPSAMNEDKHGWEMAHKKYTRREEPGAPHVGVTCGGFDLNSLLGLLFLPPHHLRTSFGAGAATFLLTYINKIV